MRGLIVVGDTLRDEGLAVMDALRGDEREVVVLTGDSAAAARPLRSHDAIDRVIAEVQPAEKSDLARAPLCPETLPPSVRKPDEFNLCCTID